MICGETLAEMRDAVIETMERVGIVGIKSAVMALEEAVNEVEEIKKEEPDVVEVKQEEPMVVEKENRCELTKTNCGTLGSTALNLSLIYSNL
jgi:hypothetical protein